ncbi:DMT family transporter [Phosphitispora fastidiosa]|uniref:DMT family transporter n=1 Tax=Phosphitispora fastidiosa TaxID=2837202 RepID=UPI001E6296CB|nr:DMT family transporter [Phosphitispora fastidiosa]MBU7005341.1 drug/metabolite transporter (DMT)-like permease [Phosphitispora fastidiosa]
MKTLKHKIFNYQPAKLLTNKYGVLAIAVFCSVLWGSAFPVLKISYDELGMLPEDFSAQIVLAGMRFFLAAVLLFIVILLQRQPIKVKRHLIAELLILGLVQTGLQYSFFYYGLAHTSGMKGSVLASSGVFFVVLLAHYYYQNDKLNRNKVFGMAAGLAGIILVNSDKHFNLVFTWQGDGALIMAGFLSAVGLILGKRLSGSLHPLLVTGWQMLFGSVLMIMFGLTGLKPQSLSFTTTAWVLLAYLAFLSAVSFSLWYSLLKYNKAGEIGIYQFMIPVSGVLLSSVFIPGESFDLIVLGGLLLVTMGTIAVNRDQKPEMISAKERI